MKKITALSLLILSISFVRAQSKIDDWAELNTFHTVMASTFHPSEEGNLEPIKKRAGEMVEKAEALQNSKIPADFNTDKIKDAINRLVSGSKELKTMVDNKQPDAVISRMLAALHDNFHEIIGLCRKGDSKEEHKDEDHNK
jgi:hypothetical protein